MNVCECGCGELVNGRFKLGHNKGHFKKFVMRNGQVKVLISKNGKKVYKPYSRIVYEDYHKCCLLSWVDVNHLDQNPLNNDISNLKPMTKNQHTSWHWENGKKH